MFPFFRHSLLNTLSFVIISTVVLIMSFNATYQYFQTKKAIITQTSIDADATLKRLAETFSKLIPAYALNEYEQIVLNEVKNSDVAAIIVEDNLMGTIMGLATYETGKIKNDEGRVIEFDEQNDKHQQTIAGAFYRGQKTIISKGKKIGRVIIYISHDTLNRELKLILIDSFINTLIISSILFLSLFIAIRYLVIKPFADILLAIRDTDADGIPTQEINNNGPVEVKSLAGALNNMIAAIKSSRQVLKEQREALDFQANHDGLTGLKNRLFFNLTLEQGISSAFRRERKFALLFIDLDRFKEINDSFGHQVGDIVLKVVSKRIQASIRGEDLLARLGGDEFVILQEEIKTTEDTSVLANKIIDILGKEIIIDKQSFYVGSSIGISVYPGDGVTPEDLLKNADAAMYHAKNEGRNNFQYYSRDITDEAYERVVMEAEIRSALVNNELQVYFQPQVLGRTGEIVGMEALVRWNSPTLGFVSPGKFIPIAERTDLIVEIDEFVLKTAMIQFSDWYKKGLNPGVLAVNLAIKDLQKDDYLSRLCQLLSQYDFQSEHLELEVTESQVMVKPVESIAMLKEIRINRIKLAIDDFGTGYSSLSYLKQLPVSKLKIDQAFVKGLPFNSEDASITKAIIALAKSLKYDLLAEGVETKEQLDFLVNHGCEKIQGFYFHRPLPAAEIELLLAAEEKEVIKS